MAVGLMHKFTLPLFPPCPSLHFVSCPFFILVGGLIISQTDDLLVPFYATMAGHIFYFIVMFFFVPELLSKWRMALTRERKKAEDEVNEELAQSSHQMRVRLVRRIQSLFKFMAPLVAFAPMDRLIHGGIIQRDWNLTYIAGSTACVSLVVVSVYPVPLSLDPTDRILSRVHCSSNSSMLPLCLTGVLKR